MSHSLSLHHVTAMEASPPELIAIAAELGLRHVTMFTCIAPEAADMFPVKWTREIRKETAARCKDQGVTVHNLEWFAVSAAADADFHRAGLELGASLGAKTATTHVVDADRAQAIDSFGRFCDLAAEFGIAPCIEFTPIVGTPTLGDALAVIEGAGRANGGIALDTLHFVRSGGTLADLRKVDPRIIRSLQISDGPIRALDMAAYVDETVFERMIPGEGEFPLRELLALVPGDLVIDVEVPLRSHQQRGLGALERSRLAVAGARSLLKELQS